MPLGEKTPRPADVVDDANGHVTRPRERYNPDGTKYNELVPCCERCWEPIPRYASAPNGYVSPDSNRKLKSATVDGKNSLEARAKVVCYECLKQDHIEEFGGFSDFPHALAE